MNPNDYVKIKQIEHEAIKKAKEKRFESDKIIVLAIEEGEDLNISILAIDGAKSLIEKLEDAGTKEERQIAFCVKEALKSKSNGYIRVISSLDNGKVFFTLASATDRELN